MPGKSDQPGEAGLPSAVREILAARGVVSTGELLDALGGAVEPGPNPESTLAEGLRGADRRVMPLIDGRWAWLPTLLDGRVFTHRLTETEVAYDAVALGADLAPVVPLLQHDDYRRLTDGAPVGVAFSPADAVVTARGLPAEAVADGVLVLPAGRLRGSGVRPGDVIGLRVTSRGLELTVIAHPVAGAVAATLARLLAAHPDRPEMLDAAVWTVCAADDDSFRSATAPLTATLVAGGLAHDGVWVAAGGFDFATWRMAGRINIIRERYGLDADRALSVLVSTQLYDQLRDLVQVVANGDSRDDEPELAEIAAQLECGCDPSVADQTDERTRTMLPTALGFLAEPAVATAVLAETISGSGGDDRSAIALGLFAESVEALAPDTAVPALEWLRAKAFQRLGDTDNATASQDAAKSLDPSWPLS